MAHTIVFHLIKVSKRMQKALGLKTGALTLSPSEAAALLFIGINKNTSQIDIALKLHLRPPSIVSLIDELEQLDLVKRQSKKTDRRKYDIKLTEKGKVEVAKIRLAATHIDEYIKSKLTKNEVNSLVSALDKLSEDNDLNLEFEKNPNRREVKNEIPSTKRQVETGYSHKT